MSLLSKCSIFAVCLFLPVFSALAAEPEVFKTSFDLKSSRPVVDLTINGEGPFQFVFDTGADQLFIQKSLVDQLGLKKIGTGWVGSPIGEGFDADRVQVDQLSLGGATLHSIEAFVNTMPPHTMGGSVVGVIGPSAFQEFGRVSFDFENGQLEIGGSSTESGKEKWIEFGKDAPLLDAKIQIGDLQIPVHIDTGNPGLMVVPTKYSTNIPLKSEIRTLGMARTVDREFAVKGAKVDLDISLGNAQISLTSIKFFDDIPVGNLGMGALHGLVLEIDWKRLRYRLSGIAKPREMRKRKRRHDTIRGA